MVWPVRGRAEENGGRAGMEVGGRIRELRAAAGMSQDDLAARVYVSRQTISLTCIVFSDTHARGPIL